MVQIDVHMSRMPINFFKKILLTPLSHGVNILKEQDNNLNA